MAHPYDRLRRIATPREGMAGCGTPERYAEAHMRQMQGLSNGFPALSFAAEPWDAPDGAEAFIHGGKWIIACSCGEMPMASPDWDLARCFQCGAVHRHLAWPRDRDSIERVLLARPLAASRTWLISETVEDLRAQNREHGVLEEPA